MFALQPQMPNFAMGNTQIYTAMRQDKRQQEQHEERKESLQGAGTPQAAVPDANMITTPYGPMPQATYDAIFGGAGGTNQMLRGMSR